MDTQILNLIKIIDINSLVISGGGIKGFIYLGAIKLFFEYGIINKIKYFYGTSFGGLIVTCLNLGWQFDEAYKFAIDFPIDCIIDYDVDNFIKNYGLVPKKNYKTLFKKLISYKGFDENITFKELYEKTSKELHLITYSLKNNKCIDLNFETTPTLKVCEGLYMTTALPILIPPYEYNNDIFIDGGIIENFPMNRIKPENINKVIGICTDSYKINYKLLNDNFVDKNLLKHIEYLLELIKVIFGSTITCDTKNYITLYFDKKTKYMNTFNYSITRNNKRKLINSGYNQSIKQFGEIIESIFKKQIGSRKIKNISKFNEI